MLYKCQSFQVIFFFNEELKSFRKVAKEKNQPTFNILSFLYNRFEGMYSNAITEVDCLCHFFKLIFHAHNVTNIRDTALYSLKTNK